MQILISVMEMIEAEVWGLYCNMKNMKTDIYDKDTEIYLSIPDAKHLGLLGCVCNLEYFQSKHED